MTDQALKDLEKLKTAGLGGGALRPPITGSCAVRLAKARNRPGGSRWMHIAAFRAYFFLFESK